MSLCAIVTFFLSTYIVESYKHSLPVWHRISRAVDHTKRNDLRDVHWRSWNRFILYASKNFIILGGSGDLSTTKIIPSLFELYKEIHYQNKEHSPEYAKVSNNDSIMRISSATTATSIATATDVTVTKKMLSNDVTPFDFTVNLVARSNLTNDVIREKLSRILTSSKVELSMSPLERDMNGELVTDFLQKCTYTCAPTYSVEMMSKVLNEAEELNLSKEEKIRNIVYFALPPKQYLPALQSIDAIRNVPQKAKRELRTSEIEKEGENDAEREVEDNREKMSTMNEKLDNYDLDIVLEKPIGYDKETANEIINLALSCVNNRTANVWCVDHYIAKEMATAIIPLKISDKKSLNSFDIRGI